MERTTRQFSISLPPDMAEQVIAVAKAESRTISELFREAFRIYCARRGAGGGAGAPRPLVQRARSSR